MPVFRSIVPIYVGYVLYKSGGLNVHLFFSCAQITRLVRVGPGGCLPPGGLRVPSLRQPAERAVVREGLGRHVLLQVYRRTQRKVWSVDLLLPSSTKACVMRYAVCPPAVWTELEPQPK